jgi:hypothetical protein
MNAMSANLLFGLFRLAPDRRIPAPGLLQEPDHLLPVDVVPQAEQLLRKSPKTDYQKSRLRPMAVHGGVG